MFGSDHGMCGRFNQAIAEHVALQLLASRREGATLRVLAVGGRVAASLEDAGIVPDELHPVPAATGRITGGVRRILLVLDRWRAEGVARIRLFHNRQVSGSRQEPETVSLFPVDFGRFRRLADRLPASKVLPTYSMPRDELLASLLRQYLFVSVFRACAESLASEGAARLMAMQAAEKNLADRQAELARQFHHARQDRITSELLDVVAGFEATRLPAAAGGEGE